MQVDLENGAGVDNLSPEPWFQPKTSQVCIPTHRASQPKEEPADLDAQGLAPATSHDEGRFQSRSFCSPRGSGCTAKQEHQHAEGLCIAHLLLRQYSPDLTDMLSGYLTGGVGSREASGASIAILPAKTANSGPPIASLWVLSRVDLQSKRRAIAGTAGC